MNKFNNAFVLSGGGTRSAIYLGMYAALEELNMKPDVLIASCGGAFAATIINTFPSHALRKSFYKSETYYHFATKDRLTHQKKLSNMGVFSFKKTLDKRNAPYIEDVYNRYLAEVPQDLSINFPSLKKTSFSENIPTLIIGSKLLITLNQIGEKRGQNKLYQKMIFTDAITASNINLSDILITSENYKNSAVAEYSEIRTDLSMLKATRVSISDMFYVAPLYHEDTYFAGGAIDLIPIELAKHVANTVIIEKKQSYTKIEEALVRSVLGFSGNKRLSEVQHHHPDFQIDTRAIKKELSAHYIKKRIDWKNLEMQFQCPVSYCQFKKDIDMQWNYGYEKTIESIKNNQVINTERESL